jgi:hypothetical protein
MSRSAQAQNRLPLLFSTDSALCKVPVVRRRHQLHPGFLRRHHPLTRSPHARTLCRLKLRDGRSIQLDALRISSRRRPVCEAARGRCKAVVKELLYDAPLQFSEDMCSRIARAAERLLISHMRLQSPAGHDARYLHYFCPTAMIFIPCKDGISHNEAESVNPADATAGARILAETAFELANQ